MRSTCFRGAWIDAPRPDCRHQCEGSGVFPSGVEPGAGARLAPPHRSDRRPRLGSNLPAAAGRPAPVTARGTDIRPRRRGGCPRPLRTLLCLRESGRSRRIERVNRLPQAVIEPEKDVRKLDAEDIRRMRDHRRAGHRDSAPMVARLVGRSMHRPSPAATRRSTRDAEPAPTPAPSIAARSTERPKSGRLKEGIAGIPGAAPACTYGCRRCPGSCVSRVFRPRAMGLGREVTTAPMAREVQSKEWAPTGIAELVGSTAAALDPK